MNRPRPTRKLLLILACTAALLGVPSAGNAVGDSELEGEPQATAVAPAPAASSATEETDVLHAQVVRGLPFSNFDLLALIAVLVGLSSISFAVHRLNRHRGEPLPPPPAAPPAETAAEAPITTDAG